VTLALGCGWLASKGKVASLAVDLVRQQQQQHDSTPCLLMHGQQDSAF
jgi:hypothetical protein